MKELFNWETAYLEESELILTNITLAKQIGRYIQGTMFSSAIFSILSGELTFQDEEGEDIATFKLRLEAEEG